MKKLMIAAVAATTLFTAACTSHAGPAQTRTAVQAQSQIERNKAVVLDFYELAFNTSWPLISTSCKKRSTSMSAANISSTTPM